MSILRLLEALPRRRTARENEQTPFHMYKRMARMIELQVPALANHGERVAEKAVAIAELMGLAPEDVEDIRQAAELRDLGYIRLNPTVLNAEGDLAGHQIQEIRRHPGIGAQMLESVPELRHLAPLVRHHHEQWNGGGYPEELSGSDIPLGARIIAVADVFDAVTSRRPYRQAYAAADAVEHLVKNAGELYDPEVVEVFVGQWNQEKRPVPDNSHHDIPRVTAIHRVANASGWIRYASGG